MKNTLSTFLIISFLTFSQIDVYAKSLHLKQSKNEVNYYDQSLTGNQKQTHLTIQQAKAGIYIVQLITATAIIRRQVMIR